MQDFFSGDFSEDFLDALKLGHFGKFSKFFLIRQSIMIGVPSILLFSSLCALSRKSRENIAAEEKVSTSNKISTQFV